MLVLPAIYPKEYMNTNKNLFKGFTKKYNLVKLVYFEEFENVLYAISAKKKVKGWLRQKKINLIQSKNPAWKDLYETL